MANLIPLNGLKLNHITSRIFDFAESEFGHRFGFLIDVPAEPGDDTSQWREQRAMVMTCARMLDNFQHACMVYAYQSVGKNNGELIYPVHAIALCDDIPPCAVALESYAGEVCEIDEVYNRAEYWVVFSQYSATLPIKLAAARYGFRAVTIPGFTKRMLPALRLDVAELDKRIVLLTQALTEAHTADITFNVNGKSYNLAVDLRYRMGIGLCGSVSSCGQIACLPPGESYIAPYESEKCGLISFTSGILPLERDGEIIICEVSENRIVCVDGNNAFADSLRHAISREPARANIAKLGLGILGDWGIQPIGDRLHDEKLALHIGLGRSDHLGGVTSPSDFRTAKNVSHIDYIYHPALMPHIRITQARLQFDNHTAAFMKDSRYIYDELLSDTTL